MKQIAGLVLLLCIFYVAVTALTALHRVAWSTVSVECVK